jgi:hypothetical protein
MRELRRQQLDPNDISKNMFLTALQAAVRRHGSIGKLAIHLGKDRRLVQKWLRGLGPSYTRMAQLYVKVVNS